MSCILENVVCECILLYQIASSYLLLCKCYWHLYVLSAVVLIWMRKMRMLKTRPSMAAAVTERQSLCSRRPGRRCSGTFWTVTVSKDRLTHSGTPADISLLIIWNSKAIIMPYRIIWSRCMGHWWPVAVTFGTWPL